MAITVSGKKKQVKKTFQELINDLMNNIVANPEPVEYDKEDIQDAVNVLETVIDSYQNSTDQENFDISDLTEEQQEQIENSDIAKAILKEVD